LLDDEEEEAVKSGARFALTQQDVLGMYLKQHPTSKIQIVMPMYNEDISVVVNRKSNIKSLKDLAGKRVAIGAPSSGNWFTAHTIQGIIGVTWLSIETPLEESILALLVGDLDAIIVVAGHPVKLFSALGDKMQSLIVMLSLPELTQYPALKLPSNTYPWQPYDVEARSTRSVLVAASNVSREEIAELLSCISSQRAALRKWGHAKWNDVSFVANRSSTPEKQK
jgi:TRAP transporter TAXI family solute receptor